MDGQGIHWFDSYFPLPYRIAIEILLGVWGWGVNVHVLDRAHVDLAYIFRYQTGRSLHKSIYEFATGLTVLLATSYFLFVTTSGFALRAVDGNEAAQHPPLQVADLLPWLTVIGIISIILYPGIRFHHNGRRRVLAVFRRICLGRIDLENRLPDILLADVLTSYSKVLVDSAIMTCMLISGKTCLGLPDRGCGGQYLVPLVSSIPFLIRLKQCMTDYLASGNILHLFNSAKYASGIPVILLSALQRKYPVSTENSEAMVVDAMTLRYMWVMAVFINSSYSFIWDVTFDWDLDLLRSPFMLRHGGLRSVLYFSPRYWYYAAIVVDYVLRCTWSLKLSSHWYHVEDYEAGLFVLGVFEIIRRWVWVFFRIEAEWVRNLRTARKGHQADVALQPLPVTELK